MRHTKIVATIGPASATAATVDALVGAGVDAFRLNFSHGTHESHTAAFRLIRAAADRAGRPVAVLQDLAGPKIRTGPLVGGAPIALAAGDTLRLAAGDFVGTRARISISFPPLLAALKPGDALLVDDGRIELRVIAVEAGEVVATAIDGGTLGEHKGINAPGVALPLVSSLTAKDDIDLRLGVSLGVDVVALSFVQSAEVLREARALATTLGRPDLPLMAKLERPEALEHLDDIYGACDAVMVARGDLGLELPLERVPRVQKEITRSAGERGLPVVVATQVLESMTTELRPTRAEVSDAANAVEDGVDAIMLAGETAVGAHPVRVVQTLASIILEAESTPRLTTTAAVRRVSMPAHAEALCAAAVTLASRDDAQGIVAVTRGGRTARLLSAMRPDAPIFAATDRPEVARALALNRGVVPLLVEFGSEMRTTAAHISDALRARGLVASRASIILVSVSPDLSAPDANFLKLHRMR